MKRAAEYANSSAAGDWDFYADVHNIRSRRYDQDNLCVRDRLNKPRHELRQALLKKNGKVQVYLLRAEDISP